VRIVRDILMADRNWTIDTFVPYGEERKERMRRLRIAARITAILEAEFDAAARERRIRAGERRRAMAPEALAMLTPFIGPDALPNEPYSDEAVAALLA
jgi:hypothetical protein